MSTSVFSRLTSAAFSDADKDQFQKADIRTDEEQQVKLDDTMQLLIAAGYFRARIKGLSPFDKTVGGMTWCITSSNFDIDVDLLYQENSTIGQKIALTEKIVAVLPKMKCPYRIEPHQIQGLDFIHIYPVVQWLVKQALETRQETGNVTRKISELNFAKSYRAPEDDQYADKKEGISKGLKTVMDNYRPNRRFRRSDSKAVAQLDEPTRIQSTLLEYGMKFGAAPKSKSEDETEQSEVAKKASAVSSAVKASAGKEVNDDEEEVVDEKEISRIMNDMSAAAGAEATVSSSLVGSIVGLQSEEIQNISSEYAGKQIDIGRDEKSGQVRGLESHKRIVENLSKQIASEEQNFSVVSQKHNQLETQLAEKQQSLAEYQTKKEQYVSEIEEFDEIEKSGENASLLVTLQDLVLQNETLKKQEQQFKSFCKDEIIRLQEMINNLKDEEEDNLSLDKEKSHLVEKQYTADKEKFNKIKLFLAGRNREIASVQRKIDEVPTRAELTQYQKRFVELYNQVATTLTETKQYFTLYNTLDDTKLYLSKEVSLLNSIHDNFQQAMASAANKEQFLKQLEQIVSGITQNRTKAEKKRADEKMRRDELTDRYLDLVDKQRLYIKTVKAFTEECKKNEILTAKLERR
ncbi:Coiled-coil domain-containing protein 93 [Trichoplax sp. H2]|nr:Coiled-coil domain-containing protein 93 [Trichoplax sp. H2]|eukprot:RDD45817.1 Coiled-coil domain-containing protein 93 [Trichoplax sp. H2]